VFLLNWWVVNCTVSFRVTVTCCAGGPPSAVVHFLTRMTRERCNVTQHCSVTLRLAAPRIRQSSNSLVLTFQGIADSDTAS
jgi:hypothetical protein